MRTLGPVFYVALLVAAAGCSKASASSSGPAGDATGAATPAAAGGTATGTSKVSINGLPIAATIKSAAPKGGNYQMTVSVTNKATKPIKTLFTSGCMYDKGGDKVGGEVDNGVDVDLKPGASADVTISAEMEKATNGFTAGAKFNSVKFADGTSQKGVSQDMFPCPSWLSSFN